eukprot:COSAG01_NODE_20707_length_939_cov_1.111905_1_plen_193_part_01
MVTRCFQSLCCCLHRSDDNLALDNLLGSQLDTTRPPLPQALQHPSKTGFKNTKMEAVLSVTSGLPLPTKGLDSVGTEEKIAALVKRHYSGGHREMPRRGLVDGGGQSQHPADQRMIVRGHRHGFIAAVTAAFADHYPLTLRPQHFWLLISQAVATHVDLNAEKVRKSWVAHKGKKELVVSCDEFVLGNNNGWA